MASTVFVYHYVTVPAPCCMEPSIAFNCECTSLFIIWECCTWPCTLDFIVQRESKVAAWPKWLLTLVPRVRAWHLKNGLPSTALKLILRILWWFVGDDKWRGVSSKACKVFLIFVIYKSKVESGSNLFLALILYLINVFLIWFSYKSVKATWDIFFVALLLWMV
jgi:hypothetical protein